MTPRGMLAGLLQVRIASQNLERPSWCLADGNPMSLSILHVSDLHRDPTNPIRNGPLLDSLQSDRRRYTTEEDPRIRPPDIIVVSGDVIQGVRPQAHDPEAVLRDQYDGGCPVCS